MNRVPAMLIAAMLAANPAAAASVWDGVYTAAQAERGGTVYVNHCSTCHRDDLSGYDSVLKGGRFMDHWREDALVSLFNAMKSIMPVGAPASLSDGEYVDLVAYVLQANGLPSGLRELTPVALGGIRVEGKSGPQEVPAGALIDVVGCLVPGAGGSWSLIQGTEPVRTRNPNDSSAAELKSWAARPAGVRRFGLMDAGMYQPERKENRKIEAKGFLIRNPGNEIINLTSLQATGAACE